MGKVKADYEKSRKEKKNDRKKEKNRKYIIKRLTELIKNKSIDTSNVESVIESYYDHYDDDDDDDDDDDVKSNIFQKISISKRYEYGFKKVLRKVGKEALDSLVRKVFDFKFDKSHNRPKLVDHMIDYIYSKICSLEWRMAKRSIEKKNIKDLDSLFCTFFATSYKIGPKIWIKKSPVLIPEDILRLIFSYFEIGKDFLNTIGSTNREFYILTLLMWDKVVVTPKNVRDIPLLILQNAKEVFVKIVRKIYNEDLIYLKKNIKANCLILGGNATRFINMISRKPICKVDIKELIIDPKSTEGEFAGYYVRTPLSLPTDKTLLPNLKSLKIPSFIHEIKGGQSLFDQIENFNIIKGDCCRPTPKILKIGQFGMWQKLKTFKTESQLQVAFFIRLSKAPNIENLSFQVYSKHTFNSITNPVNVNTFACRLFKNLKRLELVYNLENNDINVIDSLVNLLILPEGRSFSRRYSDENNPLLKKEVELTLKFYLNNKEWRSSEYGDIKAFIKQGELSILQIGKWKMINAYVAKQAFHEHDNGYMNNYIDEAFDCVKEIFKDKFVVRVGNYIKYPKIEKVMKFKFLREVKENLKSVEKLIQDIDNEGTIVIEDQMMVDDDDKMDVDDKKEVIDLTKM